MKTISIIILTYNEEKNLPNCLNSVKGLNSEIYVVDSGSMDATLEIAQKAGCKIYNHPFDNYSLQRNWSFNNLPIQTPWILCLDADERLTPELIDEINQVTGDENCKFDGYLLCKRTIFMGRWIKFGGQYPSYHLRLFKTGKAYCEQREYDQHFVLNGKLGKLKNDYIDVIGSTLSNWSLRHVRWSEMEIIENKAVKIKANQVQSNPFGNPIERKRFLKKNIYQKSPLFLRAFIFWIYVYFLRLGFFDGKEGLIFHTLRCFWFRFLVDAMLYEDKFNMEI